MKADISKTLVYFSYSFTVIHNAITIFPLNPMSNRHITHVFNISHFTPPLCIFSLFLYSFISLGLKYLKYTIQIP